MNIYKLCLAVTCMMIHVTADEQCGSRLGLGSVKDLPCTVQMDDVIETVDADDCHKYKHCCKFGEGKDAVCYAEFDMELYNKVISTGIIENVGEEMYRRVYSFMHHKPRVVREFPPGCPSPFLFMESCHIIRNEPFAFEPPVNVPYCVRSPCSIGNNDALDNDYRGCISQPGCYFDEELFELRTAFGQSVLPGVPVCQMAIKNAVFQQKARIVVKQLGIWNPYFTNCILETFRTELISPKGCEVLPFLEGLHIQPKLAGWRNINSRECSLIDGCFRPGYGCFYPADLSNVRVKSGQRHVGYSRREIVYGRPRCQAFDTSSPISILKSYHQCLSSGCTVDSSITSRYYQNLFSIGESMSVKNHWEYWSKVQKGQIGAYNIDDKIGEFDYRDENVVKLTTTPKSNNSIDSTVGLNVSAALPSSNYFAVSSGVQIFPIKDSSKSCDHMFRANGTRPCSPPSAPKQQINNYCPYKALLVPRFHPLKGRFDGCCEINLCYLSRTEILRTHSGPSHYYSEWSLYSTCSSTCGVGRKRRYRKCISEDKTKCTEPLVEVSKCQDEVCASRSMLGGNITYKLV